MDHNKKNEIDQISGVETTGHEWDGLKELNNPAPRWWLWVFYVCCIWSAWYWVVYPAWPTLSGSTEGKYGWTQYKKLENEQAEIVARQETYLKKFSQASFSDVMNDQELYAFANAGGAAAFKDNCATCHGSGGAGAKGYPNLNDDDWLWGGTVEDIYQTIMYGIRSAHDETRTSTMPAFGRDGLLKKEEVNAVVDYALTLSGGKQKETYEQGQVIFAQQCASCHGPEGKGGRDFGAPNLTDAIWLYGKDRDTVYKTVYYGRNGVMPAWADRLDQNTIRQLSVYVHQLGGGEDATISASPAQESPPQENPVQEGEVENNHGAE